MKLARKILLIATLGSLFVGVGILISAIFGNNVFEGAWLKILESLATIVVAGAFSLNALNFMHRNKIIAYITLCLLGTLTILAFVIYWGEIEFTSGFTKFVAILAMTTIFFNIMVSNYLKLNRNYFVVQIVTYSIIAAIDIILILQICEIDVISHIWQIFVIACLIVFGLLIALAVLSKKAPESEMAEPKTIDGEKVVKLKESEYNALLQKIADLETQLAEKNKEDKE